MKSAPEHLKQNLLHLENVYKSYGPKQVLDNVDLSVKAGELCTVVGPSGCGKSTLLRIIVGQERATRGDVLIDGRPVGFADADRGIVFQRYSLYPHLTALENVALSHRLKYGILAFGAHKKAAFEESMLFLEKVRLGEHAHKYPHELSGGMQQRVAIAQTLVMRPKIVLMDEPFGALDPTTRELAQLFLLELWEELKMTVFFVTHDLEEAVFLGTRILALSQFYIDDRGPGPDVNRGAKFVCDLQLPREALSTEVKKTKAFTDVISQIREVGFDPKGLRHVREFNLKHPDSFQTLTEHESSN